MEGFKKLPKQIACFREGGSVQKQVENFTKRDRKNVEPDDLAQDKKLIKKAFKQHDKAEHDKEPTEIKLKKGGRAKKEKGTVKKFCGGGNAYKEGGSVTNVYEAKKSSGDKDNIRKTKDIKPGKAAAPSKAAVKPNFFGSDVEKEKSKPSGHKDPYIKSKQSGKAAVAPSGAKGPDAYKKGGKVKKFADGGDVANDPNDIGGGMLRAIGKVPLVGGVMQDQATDIRNKVMGTPEQNRIAQAQMDKMKARKAAQAAAMAGGLGGAQALQQGALAGAQAAPAPVTPAPAPMKKGGKACR
jgi:hypothetical protein